MTLLELLGLMKKHLKLIIGLPVVCAALIGAYAFVVMPNEYTATSSMYVLANQGETATNLSADLSASQMVANDITTILKSDRAQKAAADELGLKDLKDFEVAVSSQTTSRVIELSVTGSKPEQVANVANSITNNVATISREVMEADTVRIIDPASAPVAPSGPSRPLYIAVAFLAGLFMAVAIVVLEDMLNTKVRSAEDVEEILGIPVIGRVPAVKGGRS